MKTGDIISAIDDTDITDMEVSEVADMIREGEKKQAVLTIHRQNEEMPLKLTVEITDVTLPSVFEEMLKDQVGYIRISEFTDVTPDQFREAFFSLKKKGMEKLIVDLRGNPGGLLTSVCSILNEIDVYKRQDVRRVVMIMELEQEKDHNAMEAVKSFFGGKTKDFITAVDERSIIIVKQLEDGENYSDMDKLARAILDTLGFTQESETHIAYGTIVNELKEVSRSYKEARMALDVGKIFFGEKDRCV